MVEIQDWRREVSSNNPLVWQPDGAKASARQQAIGHHFTIAGWQLLSLPSHFCVGRSDELVIGGKPPTLHARVRTPQKNDPRVHRGTDPLFRDATASEPPSPIVSTADDGTITIEPFSLMAS